MKLLVAICCFSSVFNSNICSKYHILTELSNNKDKMVKLHVGIFGYSNQYLLQFSVTDLNFQ